jgi:hypothetical protein
MAASSKALRLAILINNHATTVCTVPSGLRQELGQPVAGLGAGRGVVVAAPVWHLEPWSPPSSVSRGVQVKSLR